MSLHPFRFGVSLFPSDSRAGWQAKARQAEDLGYDIVQVPDHLGLPAPFLLASLAAIMAWLPYLGSIGGGLLVVLVAAHNFPGAHGLPYEVVGLFIGVRLLDDIFFMPLTVGRSLHVHPLVTMLMFLLGGAVAGIAGLLLVMPVLGIVMVAGQIIGELLTDERILARHRHAQLLRRKRARADLFDGWDSGAGL